MHILIRRFHPPVSQDLFEVVDFQAVVDLIGGKGVPQRAVVFPDTPNPP
jgi:hypothetical protein